MAGIFRKNKPLVRVGAFRCVVKGGDLSARFATVPERIIETAKRLKNVQIENRSAQELIPEYKSKEVLIYTDPPYVLKSRTGGKVYAHEMTDEQHHEFLDVLIEHPGPVILSGYDCDLYRNRLAGWTRKIKQNMTQRAQIKEESIWLNQVAARNLDQLSLF